MPCGAGPAGARTLTDSAEITEQKAILRGHMAETRSEAAARDPDAAERLAARFPMKLFDRYGPVVAGTIAIGDELFVDIVETLLFHFCLSLAHPVPFGKGSPKSSFDFVVAES